MSSERVCAASPITMTAQPVPERVLRLLTPTAREQMVPHIQVAAVAAAGLRAAKAGSPAFPADGQPPGLGGIADFLCDSLDAFTEGADELVRHRTYNWGCGIVGRLEALEFPCTHDVDPLEPLAAPGCAQASTCYCWHHGPVAACHAQQQGTRFVLPPDRACKGDR